MNASKALPLLAALAMGTGCIGDDAGGDGDSGDTGGNMTMTTASTMTTMTTMGDTTMSMTTMGGTADETGTGDDDDDDDDESSSGGVDPELFIFDETPPDDYTQVDRKGFPGVNTGLNIVGDKDAYNASNPAEDVSGPTAANNAEDSLDYLHDGLGAMGNGLDDDLTDAGFDPCPTVGVGDCLEQAGPFIIPDTLNVTVGGDANFPNGRRPEEPVMDIILAVILLDLDTHALTAFLDLDDDGTLGDSLNPFTNDATFPGDWPYLADPHEP